MDVRMPDGTIISGVPDNITKSELLRRYESYQKTQQPEPTKDTGLLDMTGRAFTRGVKQLGSTLGDVLPAMVGSAVGADEFAKRQMEEAAATQKEIQEKYAPRYKSYRDVEGIGDVLPYILETGVEQIPNIASVLVPGGVAGLGGRAIAGRAATEAVASRAAAKGLEGEAAAQFAGRTAGAVAAKELAGQKVGQAAGVYLGSYALNSPEIFQNIFEETGQLEPGAAALAGSVSAALDSIFPAFVMNKFTPGMKAGVVEKILERSGMKPGIARGVTAGVVTGVATEGPTEAAQEAISIAAEKFVNENAGVWDSKDFQRIVDSGVAGAAGSILFGGAAGAIGGYREKAAARREEEAKKAPRGKNAYEEADETDTELETTGGGVPSPAPPTAEDLYLDELSEAAFPSMQTLQSQYEQLETERKGLLNQEQNEQVQTRLQEIDELQLDIAEQQDQLEARLQRQRAPATPPAPTPAAPPAPAPSDLPKFMFGGSRATPAAPPPATPAAPQAAMGEEQMGLGLGEPVAPGERTALPPTTSAEAPQIGLDLGAPVEGGERAALNIPIVEPAQQVEQLVTDVSAAPLERFLSAFQPSSPSETEQEKQRNAVSGERGIVRAIRDMYEDLKVDDADLPYYTGLVKDFFKKFLKPVSPEVAPMFDNVDKMSAQEQKDFLQRYTNLPDITTYDGVNRLKLAFNDFISEQQLKAVGITPGTNAYTQAKKTLAALRSKATNTPNKLDKAERAAHDYFRRFDFDTSLRAAAFDMAYGTPRNEMFSGQGAEFAPYFQEWLLTNASEAVNKKFDSYVRAYEHRATRDAQVDQIREEKNKTAEAEASTREGYEEATRAERNAPAEEIFEPEPVTIYTPQYERAFDFRKIFGTSEEITGSLTQMLHPAVERAIKANDVNGALRAMLATSKLTTYQKQLVSKLLSLNLKTSVGIGTEALDQNMAVYLEPGSEMVRDYFYVARQLGALRFPDYANKMMDVNDKTTNNDKLVAMYYAVGEILVADKTNPQIPENIKAEMEPLLDELRNRFLIIERSVGAYFPVTDAISLHPKNGPGALTNYTFLHEMIHAATTNIINNPAEYGAKQQRAVQELEKLYEFAKTTSGIKKYGFTDLNEFVAEAFTNHEFQKVLQGLNYKGSPKSLWDKFVEFCMKMFGYDNVLGQTMRYGNVLMSSPPMSGYFASPQAARKGYYENNSNEQPGALRSIGKQIKDSKSFDDIKFLISESWSTMKDQTRKYFLGAFTLRQLEEMMGIEYNRLTGEFETKVPQVSVLIKNIEDMQDSRNKLIQKGKPIVDKLQKLYTSNQATADALTVITQTSTALQIDPTNPNPPADKAKKKMYDKLRADWEALGKMKDGTVAQELYVEMRDFFKGTLQNYKRIAAEREYRRILGSKEAANRAANEYVEKNLPEFKKMYTDKTEEELRGMIEADLLKEAAQLVNAGKESNETALARVLADKKINKQFEKMIEPYFPLKRFGRFWYKEGTGENMKFYMFESAFARNEALKKARAASPKESFASGNDTRSMTSTALQNARLFEEIKDVIGDVSATTTEEQKQKLLDEIGELFITTLPTQSIRNMFLHRKNVPGASADMVRSFSHAMFHLGYQQARFEYAPKMFDSMNAARAFLSSGGVPTTAEEDSTRRTLKDYLDEIQRRVDNVLSPVEQNWITTMLSNLSFLTYLTAPASAVVNMLAVPMIGYPVLAGPYGWGPSRQAYTKYMKMLSGAGWKDEFGNFDAPSVSRNPKLTEIEKRAYQAFVDAGLIDISMTHDIAGLSEQPSNEYTGRWNKIMTIASFPFHKAERFNREVTAMAAFDLAYKANGGNFEDAVNKAKDLTYKSMFDYSTANKPRYFQGDLPKILLQFKQYAQHMTYLLFRTAYEASSQLGKAEYDQLMAEGKVDEANKVMEMAKQIRQDARRTFTGMMGMSFLFAGSMGMPVWFIFSGVANAFAAAFGDDEEEYDVENWYKNWLNSVFGGFVGDSIARGVVPQLTGASLSDRMSTNLTDMWWRDTKRNQDEVSTVQNVMINLLGPVAGMGINAAEAVKRFNDGHTYRAFEAISPAVLKNVLVGSRIASEGALTMKGDTLLEDISAKEAFLQLMGFTPERLAQRQAANIEAKATEVALNNRRQDLLNFLAMAYDAEDDDGVEKILEKIEVFNDQNPEFVIKGSTIRSSLKKRAKERAMSNERDGLRIGKAFSDRAEEMTRYAEEDEE